MKNQIYHGVFLFLIFSPHVPAHVLDIWFKRFNSNFISLSTLNHCCFSLSKQIDLLIQILLSRSSPKVVDSRPPKKKRRRSRWLATKHLEPAAVWSRVGPYDRAVVKWWKNSQTRRLSRAGKRFPVARHWKREKRKLKDRGGISSDGHSDAQY